MKKWTNGCSNWSTDDWMKEVDVQRRSSPGGESENAATLGRKTGGIKTQLGRGHGREMSGIKGPMRRWGHRGQKSYTQPEERRLQEELLLLMCKTTEDDKERDNHQGQPVLWRTWSIGHLTHKMKPVPWGHIYPTHRMQPVMWRHGHPTHKRKLVLWGHINPKTHSGVCPVVSQPTGRSLSTRWGLPCGSMVIWPTVWSLSQGRPSPEPMVHFHPVSDFPPVSENVSLFLSFKKNFKFSFPQKYVCVFSSQNFWWLFSHWL